MHNYVIEMEEIIESPERQVRGKILFVHFQFVSFFFTCENTYNMWRIHL